MLRAARDWAGTAAFFVVFAALMLSADLAFRVAVLFGRRANDYALGALQVALVYALRLCGTRIEVERSAAIRPYTSYIVVSNHQSMFDIPVFGWQLFTNFPKYVAKVELARWIPAVSFQLRHGGHALIDRRDRENAVRVIRQLADQVLHHGGSAVIFPEGTRARAGRMAPFKPAGTVALLEQAPDTPILPVCIDASWRIVSRGMRPIPWGVRIRCWMGDPIERRPGEDARALVAEVEQRIRAAMARFRGEAPEAAVGSAAR